MNWSEWLSRFQQSFSKLVNFQTLWLLLVAFLINVWPTEGHYWVRKLEFVVRRYNIPYTFPLPGGVTSKWIFAAEIPSRHSSIEYWLVHEFGLEPFTMYAMLLLYNYLWTTIMAVRKLYSLTITPPIRLIGSIVITTQFRDGQSYKLWNFIIAIIGASWAKLIRPSRGPDVEHMLDSELEFTSTRLT